MDFHLQPGEKFACVAFENLEIDHSLSTPLSLGQGLWTLPEHPFDLDNRWREWIGKIKADQIGRCNFFLLAVKASTRPEILDDENEVLRRQLNRLLYGLLLQGKQRSFLGVVVRIPREPFFDGPLVNDLAHQFRSGGLFLPYFVV